MALLKNIDYFRAYEAKKHTRSQFGGFLTILIPVSLIFYALWELLVIWRAPLRTVVKTETEAHNVFTMKVSCAAEEGCYFSQRYNLDSKCTESLLSNGFDLYEKCVYLRKGDNAVIPFCYTADPDEGPKAFWKRLRPDEECQTSQPPAHCYQMYGMRLEIKSLLSTGNSISQIKKVSKFINLFYGEHALSLVNNTVSGHDDFSTIQTAPVQISNLSKIRKNNPCCPEFGGAERADGTVIDCDSADNGNANDKYISPAPDTLQLVPGDYYQLEIRSFPTYTSSRIYEKEILSELLASLGGAFSVILGVATVLSFLYKLFFPSSIKSVVREDSEMKVLRSHEE